MLDDSSIIGSSHGLLCLYGSYDRGCVDHHIHETNMAVVWNISIRKVLAVVVPNVGHGIYHTVLGFGVCRETNDPKIVKITQIDVRSDIETITSIPWQVEVFTLSIRAWRRPYSSNLPRKSVEFCNFQVVIDETLYWLVMDRTTMDGGFMSYNLIISFDMTTEEFREVNLPDTLAHDQCNENLYISKLSESLVVPEHGEDETVVIVWKMEDAVSKMFTKLFSIYTPDATILGVSEFRKSGEPIIEIEENGDSTLVVYESHSKRINNLGIDGSNLSFSVSFYTESLLLLDQPNFIIYDKGKCYILKR